LPFNQKVLQSFALIIEIFQKVGLMFVKVAFQPMKRKQYSIWSRKAGPKILRRKAQDKS